MKKLADRLVERIVTAEREAATWRERHQEATRSLIEHHKVSKDTPLPANCPHCGAVLVRDFR